MQRASRSGPAIGLNGDENVSQKWLMAVSGEQALSVINEGVYGSSVAGKELRLTLLRSPAYTGHSLPNRLCLRVHCDLGAKSYSRF